MGSLREVLSELNQIYIMSLPLIQEAMAVDSCAAVEQYFVVDLVALSRRLTYHIEICYSFFFFLSSLFSYNFFLPFVTVRVI